jgi:hypothetical protein
MCAYNVRRNKSLDHDPAAGRARKANLLREIGVYGLGLLAIGLVIWLVRRYLL